MKFEVVVLSEIGDYLLKSKEDMERTEKGLTMKDAYLVTEEGKAQKVQAQEMTITENALQGIQKGEFEEEVV